VRFNHLAEREGWARRCAPRPFGTVVDATTSPSLSSIRRPT